MARRRENKSDKFEKMRRRTRRHAHNSQKKGGNYSIQLPDGIETWEPDKVKIYKIDILPYVITRANHPDEGAAEDAFEAGDVWYRRPYGQHFKVGGNNKNTVICPEYTFGLPCPICEEVDRLCADGYNKNKELIEALRPDRFCLYNILIEDKIHVFDWKLGKFANLLEKELDQPSMEEDTDVDLTGFALLKDGYTVKTRIVEDSYNGIKFLTADKIAFVAREDIDDSIIDKLPELDEVFKEVGYEDIKKMFLGSDTRGSSVNDSEDGDMEEEEEEEKPKEKPKTKSRSRKKFEKARQKVDEVFEDKEDDGFEEEEEKKPEEPEESEDKDDDPEDDWD